MVGGLFLAARAAVYPDILRGDRYVLGTAVTMTTFQFAQVIGFAAGGIAVVFLGMRISLLTFAGNGVRIIKTPVRSPGRPPGELLRGAVCGDSAARVVKLYIGYPRKKIDAKCEPLIHAVRGVGNRAMMTGRAGWQVRLSRAVMAGSQAGPRIRAAARY